MSFSQNYGLTGTVTDGHSGEGLPNAKIYFPDLKRGTVTDSTGYYNIKNLPGTNELVEVSYIGYKQIVKSINLKNTSVYNFSINEAVAELDEVVVTGLSKSAERNRTPAPITIFSSKQLTQVSSVNVVDAIATLPGISQISSGPGISKPVIRGLGFNRVVTVHDGIRQEGQQWGDEHGIEIDENDVDRVEILKGPASLAYGSDALAGVINFLPATTLPAGTISGNILGNFQSNNGLIGGSANIGGNQDGLIWDLRYSKKSAHAYRNQYDGYVANSAFLQDNLSALIGLNKSWGYSHLKFGNFQLQPSIIEGVRDSTNGKFLKPIALNDSLAGEAVSGDDDFHAYQPDVPYQKINHLKLVSSNHFFIGPGALNVILGWQQNRRQEFENILSPETYGLYFYMNTLNYDLKYNLSTGKQYEWSMGINGMKQHSLNKGTEFLIPDYELFDFGVYTLLRKSWEKWTVSGGLRYDIRSEQGADLWLDQHENRTNMPDANSTLIFSSFDTRFQGVTGSLGATFQINDHLYTKLNLSKGFRSPNIAELAANGVHEGTQLFLIGNPLLKSENSYQTDYTFGINTEHVTGEVDLFYNKIDNFIYLQKLNSLAGGDSLMDGNQTFKYISGDAHLYGGELTLDIHPHPLDWLHFENSFSIVQSVQSGQPDSLKYLPFTPAPKFHSELRVDLRKTGTILSNAYARLSMDKYFAQNHFYSAFGTETATPGYSLFNFGLGADILSRKRTLFTLIFNINNLTDKAYQSHLSRLKYQDKNNVTNRMGVFNMGRNLSIKLMIPISIHKITK